MPDPRSKDGPARGARDRGPPHFWVDHSNRDLLADLMNGEFEIVIASDEAACTPSAFPPGFSTQSHVQESLTGQALPCIDRRYQPITRERSRLATEQASFLLAEFLVGQNSRVA
jgi:hypothetical protein